MARALRLSHADAGPWIAFCQRAFDVEGVAYVVDNAGAAH
jgi:hypothetical protein